MSTNTLVSKHVLLTADTAVQVLDAYAGRSYLRIRTAGGSNRVAFGEDADDNSYHLLDEVLEFKSPGFVPQQSVSVISSGSGGNVEVIADVEPS